MSLIPLILLGLVFLAGAVSLAIGHKGWHWATVTAAWLVLLSALGAFFLVGMLGKREQELRKVVASYQGAIARERDAMTPAGGTLRPDPASKSLATLEDERDRWTRVRDRINTWRGRHWDDAAFVPPADGRPGSVTINGLDNTTINPGAEFYLFDATPIEQGGRFLGAYRVDAVDRNTFAVSAISTPDAADKQALAQPRDGKVVVYEDLPVDRSMAFFRTPVPAAPGENPDPGAQASPGASAEAVPAAVKSDPDALLKHLERRLEEFRLHDTPLGDPVAAADPVAPPEESPDVAAGEGDGPAPGVSRPVPDPTLSETPPLGVHWARVEFGKPFEYTWQDGSVSSFAAGEVLPSLPAEQVAALRDKGADITSRWSIPPGLYWANVEFKQAHAFPRAQGEPVEFDVGRTASFDLETAKALEQQGIVAITSVIFRRPLADGNVALRGAGAVQADGRSLPMDVNGLVVIRRILEEEKRAIDSAIGQLGNAKESTAREIALKRSEAEDLEDDLQHWTKDVAAARRTAASFASRVADVRRELSDSETAIGALGSEFTDITTALTQGIDGASPPPARPPLPAGVAR